MIFLFNLIVGTGALTLPSAFAKTGWLLGLILIIILAFISYMTVTFVIETMACANAIMHWTRLDRSRRAHDTDNVSAQIIVCFLPMINYTATLKLTELVLFIHFYSKIGVDDMDSNGEDEPHSSSVGDYGNVRLIHNDNTNATIEHVPLFSQRTRYYQIENKIELVDMARLFFNDTGRFLFFACFAIYLYGDLSIYAAAISNTLRDVIW